MPALDHMPLGHGRASFPLLHQSLARDVSVSHLLQTSPGTCIQTCYGPLDLVSQANKHIR